MGRALELVGGRTTAPGAVLTTLTPNTGQSFTVRGTDTSKGTWLLNAWSFEATAGVLRITSPRLHDQVQGIRHAVTVAFPSPLMPGPQTASIAQRLYAQDNMTVQLSGGGAGEIDVASLLIAYDDLGGVNGRFIDVPTLKKNGLNQVTAEVTCVAVVTGDWGGAVAINSTFDNLIANTDYAILGGLVDVVGCSVGITGVDLGNLRCGFPCDPGMRHDTNNFFMKLAEIYGAPYIPVFNSANKTQTIIDVMTGNAGGTYLIDLNLVQLQPGSVAGGSTGAAAAGAAQPGA
jgi:hypothetical protein